MVVKHLDLWSSVLGFLFLISLRWATNHEVLEQNIARSRSTTKPSGSHSVSSSYSRSICSGEPFLRLKRKFASGSFEKMKLFVPFEELMPEDLRYWCFKGDIHSYSMSLKGAVGRIWT